MVWIVGSAGLLLTSSFFRFGVSGTGPFFAFFFLLLIYPLAVVVHLFIFFPFKSFWVCPVHNLGPHECTYLDVGVVDLVTDKSVIHDV